MNEQQEFFAERFVKSQAKPKCDLNTGIGLPCPFCAAPYFTTYPIFECEPNAHPILTCDDYGRTGRFVFELIELQGMPAHKFYILQHSGPPLPAWFTKRIGWMQ